MKETGKERFILTKAYEIAYALFRLAAQMPERDFSEKLRTAGATLLEATAKEDYVSAAESVQVMECLIKFAGDVNMIGTANADVILREIYALDAAIAECKNTAKTDAVNVAEIFSKPEFHTNIQEQKQSTAKAFAEEPPAIYESSHESPSAEEPAGNINGILKSAIRQTAILERIRQSGNCRLKDIQEILPDASERTIRYDLQTLLEQNLIERIGNAGPSVFYRATQAA